MESREKAQQGPARHAKVVPAFVLAVVSRPFETWIGNVWPNELVAWTRKGDLTDSLRRELRLAVVKRTRVRADRLWSQPTGVRLAPGWRDALTAQLRARVETLPLTPDRPLEVWTLREVKECLHLPLEHTLEILACLESVYWEPPPPVLSVPSAPQEQFVPLTSDIEDTARRVLELPWLAKVSPDDLRFSFESSEALSHCIPLQLNSQRVPSSFPSLLERLLAADSSTASAEAIDIAVAAARHCAPRSGGAETATRWSNMLLRRYISPVGDGRTLAEVGEEFGVSRERIRQVCDAFEEFFLETTIATPALDRVLSAAARVAPAQVSELDDQLRRFIGEEAGIEALVPWAKLLGARSLPVHCERIRTRIRGQLVEVTMVALPNASPWVEAMLRHVSRDMSMFGCTNVLRVAGRLALKEELAPGQDSMEAALEAAAGFRWLDRQSGWFTLGDSSACSAAARVRKIVAVAQESVGTDEIAGALASDDMWMYREASTLGLATPPVHVLRELFLGWNWLKVVQKGRFVASPSFDPQGVLSDVEQAIVDVITANDGIACRFELKDVVLTKMGLTDVLLAATLGSSPIVERVEHGMYRLRGRRVSDGALAAARRRLRERSQPGSLPHDILPNEFVARVTEAALRNEQYHVPTSFHPRLLGKRHPVLDDDGRLIGQARVGQAGTLAGINRLFPHLQPGDQIRVQVLDDGLRVRHCPGAPPLDPSPPAP